jgi:hypothetical protein
MNNENDSSSIHTTQRFSNFPLLLTPSSSSSSPPKKKQEGKRFKSKFFLCDFYTHINEMKKRRNQ